MTTTTLLPTGVAALLVAQSGVASLMQLEQAGLTRSFVASQVEGRRWRRVGEHCVVSHNYEPTPAQRMWLALLQPPPPVALAAWSSLQTAGFTFFGQEMDLVHTVVPRGVKVEAPDWLRVHESRRFSESHIDPASPIPRTRLPRSALDAAAWQPSIRYASALLAAVVQQRICTADDLALELAFVGRIRHKAHMRLVVQDIQGGAEALSEIDVADLCRRYQLKPPDRQLIRRDRQGRKRYLDCEWDLGSGLLVVLEVDGGHHMLVANWGKDIKRERRVVISGRRVLRATAYEARHEQADLAQDLKAVGIPHPW